MADKYTREFIWMEYGQRLKKVDPEQHDYVLAWVKLYVEAREEVAAAEVGQVLDIHGPDVANDALGRTKNTRL